MAKYAAQIMLKQDIGGNIVNLSSKSGLEASKNNSAYNATKAGEIHLARGWAMELGEADAFMTRDRETKEPLKDEDGNFVEITPDCIDRVAEQYRKHDMPGGWLLVNDGYGCGYVELPQVVSSLADLGFYTGLWTEKGLEKTVWEVGTAGTRLQKLDVAWTGPAYQFSLDANI